MELLRYAEYLALDRESLAGKSPVETVVVGEIIELTSLGETMKGCSVSHKFTRRGGHLILRFVGVDPEGLVSRKGKAKKKEEEQQWVEVEVFYDNEDQWRKFASWGPVVLGHSPAEWKAQATEARGQ